MKIVLDTNRCELHGECMMAAPAVFTIDDDAQFATILDENPPEELRRSVEEAAMMCPLAAIRIED